MPSPQNRKDLGPVRDPRKIDYAQELLEPLAKISAIFKDPLPDDHVHVIALAPSRELWPPKTLTSQTSALKRPRSPDDDKPREFLARRVQINHVFRAKPPSHVSNIVASMQTEQRDHPIYNDRPNGLAGPPLSIHEPIFAAIHEKLRNLDSVDGDDLLELVAKLVETANKTYGTECAYREGTVGVLGDVLGVQFTEFSASGTGPRGTTESDAVALSPLSTTSTQAGKLELGIGSDGQLQNALSQRKLLVEHRFEKVLNLSCCPSILITIAGQYIAFSGFLLTEVWISQPFTTYLPLRRIERAPGEIRGFTVQDKFSKTLLLPRPTYEHDSRPPEDL
ncbi:hypothetical protein FA15DRAFT_705124 [Coprinopsis marcescibilis]|uniref:Uncharacterized protein n=1 Tax=Coprinopsis marcescibilis TaxID=230819 RepID=A0A5C3KU70_COPMA|nr:hypothetical protein FA15DRAFT_705124 [Coprinopsis marcescibilis]